MIKETWYRRTTKLPNGGEPNQYFPIGYTFKVYKRNGSYWMMGTNGGEWQLLQEDVDDGYWEECKEYSVKKLLQKLDEA